MTMYQKMLRREGEERGDLARNQEGKNVGK
jgi:hypothetical protein